MHECNFIEYCPVEIAFENYDGFWEEVSLQQIEQNLIDKLIFQHSWQIARKQPQ